VKKADIGFAVENQEDGTGILFFNGERIGQITFRHGYITPEQIEYGKPREDSPFIEFKRQEFVVSGWGERYYPNGDEGESRFDHAMVRSNSIGASGQREGKTDTAEVIDHTEALRRLFERLHAEEDPDEKHHEGCHICHPKGVRVEGDS
jgi:hypothetical protein